MSNWQTHKARSQSGFVKVSSVKKAFLMSIKVCDYKYGSRGWEMGPRCWWPALLVRAWDRHNGKCHQMSQSQSDQLYQGSGDKSLRAKAGAKCWLFTAGCISKLAVCPLSNVKLDLIQGSCTSPAPAAGRRQTLSLQSEKRLSGSGECFKFSQAGVSLSLWCVIIPQVQTKTLSWSLEPKSRLWPGQRAPSTGPAQPAQSWLA